MAGSQKVIWIGVAIGLIFLFGVCIATKSEDSSMSENSSFENKSNSQPSLAEYWDLDACGDLVQRIQSAVNAGYDWTEVALSLEQTEGAVKRYGVMAVLSHCESRFQDLIY